MLIVGEESYAVHRANLACGPRASTFFRKTFARAAADDSMAVTNLSNRLPKECWTVVDQVQPLVASQSPCTGLRRAHSLQCPFPPERTTPHPERNLQILDFFYDDKDFKPDTASVILLLKASIVLGMKELRLRALEFINATLTKDSALVYLRHSGLEGQGQGLSDVILSSVHVAGASSP